MDSLMSFAAAQMAAGRPRPKITNSVQSRTGKCLGALSSKVDGLFMGERRPNEPNVSSYRGPRGNSSLPPGLAGDSFTESSLIEVPVNLDLIAMDGLSGQHRALPRE